jgi:hypothetical protein
VSWKQVGKSWKRVGSDEREMEVRGEIQMIPESVNKK